MLLLLDGGAQPRALLLGGRQLRLQLPHFLCQLSSLRSMQTSLLCSPTVKALITDLAQARL